MAAGRIVLAEYMPARDRYDALVSGAKLYIYENGTTTLASIYSDADLTVPAANPIVANASGQFPTRWIARGTTDSPALYSLAITGPSGESIGNPSTFDNYSPSANEEASESAAAAAAALEQAETALSQTQLARNVAQAAADEAANENGLAQLAAQNAIAASLAANYYPAAQSYVPQGATGHGAITGGSGGTNGTFSLAFTSGNFLVNPTGTFTVSGGAVTAITITGPGLYIGASPTAPTLSFAASSGLTSASASLTVGVLVQSGETYWTDHASDVTMASLYLNVAGTATATSPLVTFPKTLGLFANGGLGQVLADPTANIYLDRPALSDQPRSALDLTVNGNVQFLTQNVLSNPATRFTPAVVSGVREVTFVHPNFIPVVAMTNQKAIGVGNIYEVEAEFVQATGVAGNVGVGIAFTTTAPVLGGASGNMATNARIVMLRSNGATITTQSDAFTNATDLVKTTEEISLGWALWQRIAVQFEPLVEDGSTGRFRFFTDGEPNGSIRVVGLPPNAYFGLVGRGTNGTPTKAKYYLHEAFAPSLDVPRDLYLDPAASAGASGAKDDPFGTSRELAMAIYRDRARKTFRVHINGGVWDDFSLTPPPDTDFQIYAYPGTHPVLNGSVAIEAEAGWVQVDPVNAPEVWKLANPADQIGIGGLVQTDRPSSFGLSGLATGFTTGKWMVDYSLYARRGPDYAPTSLKRGEMSTHFNGTHDAHLLVRCWDGSDPNDHTWRFTTRFTVIDARHCRKLTIGTGITLAGAYSYGIWGDGTEFDLTDTRIRQIMVGNGLQCKDSYGTVKGVTVEGCYFDTLHWNDSVIPLGQRPRIIFTNCTFAGAFYYDDGAGFGVIADTMSNHKNNAGDFIGCRFIGAGKAGAATSGDVTFIECEFDDHIDSGVILYADSGDTAPRTVSIKGGSITGSSTGITVTGVSYEGANLALTCEGTRFGGQTNRNVNVYSTATSKTIVGALIACEKAGPAPPQADIVSAGTSLTIVNGEAYG